MRHKHLFAGAAVIAVMSLGSATADASVLYDNITGTPSDGTDAITSLGPLYDSFSTGASAFGFSHLDLVVKAFVPANVGSVAVGLYSDSSITPGGLLQALGTVSDGSLTTTPSVVGFNFSAYSLTAGTRYWIGLTSTDSTIEWSYSNSLLGVGVAGQYFANANGVFANDPGAGPYQMRVSDAVATPLPAALPLFATGLGALSLLGWRRKRKARMTAA